AMGAMDVRGCAEGYVCLVGFVARSAHEEKAGYEGPLLRRSSICRGRASKIFDERVTVAPFFFSSRRRHTILVSYWSSDVCSSDLAAGGAPAQFVVLGMGKLGGEELNAGSDIDLVYLYDTDEGAAVSAGAETPLHDFWTRVARSEERRGGEKRRGEWAWRQVR